MLPTLSEVELVSPLFAAAYAAKKAELAEERRRREAEREAAKEARKQRMRDYMEKNLLEVGTRCVSPPRSKWCQSVSSVWAASWHIASGAGSLWIGPQRTSQGSRVSGLARPG